MFYPAEAGGRFRFPEVYAVGEPYSPLREVEKTGIGVTDLGSNPGFVLHEWCDLEQVVNYSEPWFPCL